MPMLEQCLFKKLGTPIRDREFRLGNAVIWSWAFGVGHAAGYTGQSEVRQSYPECPTPNIDTIRIAASYKSYSD